MRSRNSWSERKWYSRASCSPGRRSRVVADTVTSSTGTRSSSSRISVPLPAPDGPVTTTTDGRRRQLTVEEANQLRALPLRQAADRLRLADPARAEEARSFHAPELRHRHQNVDHLRGRHVLGWVAEDRLDPDSAVLEVLLELRAAHPHVVCPLERVHPLIERAERCVCLRFRRRHGERPILPTCR